MVEKSTYVEQLDRLLESCFEELQKLPDQEILAGESLSAVRDRAFKRIEQAAAEAGRRRLLNARQKWHERSLTHRDPAAVVTAAEARAYIARVVRDSRHTLAARNLEEMSGDDLLRLYHQIRELEAENSKQNP